MSLIRAAAYIRYREDRKTRRGKLKCKPPNKACGNRCIPPNWDCRLKGEGNDPHLKAAGKGVDVTAGLANVERGVKRIGKGIVKLSASEVEGGRRAISRGAKKLAPGNLQQKQKWEKRVYRTIGAIGAPLSIGIVLALGHQSLKGMDDRSAGHFAYRNALGNKIDNSWANASSQIRRNMPLGFGDRFRAQEQAAARALNQTGNVMRNVTGVPEVPLAQTPGSNYLRKRTSDGGSTFHKAVLHAQGHLEYSGRTHTRTEYSDWVKQSRHTFWTTPRSIEGGGAIQGINNGGSVFSVAAANDLLSKSFGFPNTAAMRDRTAARAGIRRGPVEAHESIIRRIATELDETSKTIQGSMRQIGLDPSKANDVEVYLNRTRLPRTGLPEVDARSRGFISDLVTSHKTGTAHTVAARKLYNETVAGFDIYHRQIADSANTPPGLNRDAQRNSVYTQANRAHAAFLGRAIGVKNPVIGPGTEAAALRIYHARNVMGRKSAPITDIEMFNALSELYPKRLLPRAPDEQLEMLNAAYKGSRGFTKFLRMNRPIDGPVSVRRRGDEEDADRQRQDKKCGKSGIAPGKKCTKQTAATAPEPDKTAAPASAEVKKRAGTLQKIAIGGALASIAATGALVAALPQETAASAVKAMSAKQVDAAINALPAKYAQAAKKLVGQAKYQLLAGAMQAKKQKLEGINTEHNYSTFSTDGKKFSSVGSVNDFVVNFETKPLRGSIGKTGLPSYTMSFMTDLSFDANKKSDRATSMKLARQVESMFNDHRKLLPKNSLMYVQAHEKDGKGSKRMALYKRFGFAEIETDAGTILAALQVNGKIVSMPKTNAELYELLNQRTDAYFAAYTATQTSKAGV